jgi:KaiC/GvpD/RAD55 family RecA-like ATPase/DNA-binding XRE family transcriptional regulator
MSNDTLTTGQRIKAARIEKGWSQKQLAEAAGVQQADVSRWERGKISPQASQVDRIMAAIGGSHILDAVDGVLGIQGRAAGKLNIIDPTAEPIPVEPLVSCGGSVFVARGFLTMVAGEPGAGKSMLTQTVATALVEGREEVAGFALTPRTVERECTDTDCDYLAKRDPRKDSAVHSHIVNDTRVLVLDAENGENIIQERAQKQGLTADQAPRYVVAASDGFDVYKDRAVLDGILADYRDAGTPVDLIVLDSMTSIWFGNENVVDQVSPMLKYLNDTAKRFGLGILLIHHTDKEGENYRGSSAIAATIGGGVFTFARYDEKEGEDYTARRLACRKMRIAREPEPHRIYITGHGVDDKPATSEQNIALSVADRDRRVDDDNPGAGAA